jgi:hypothetical protein
VESLVRHRAFPAAAACPGVLNGRRFASVGEIGSTERGNREVSSTRIYTTIYEITGPDVVNTTEFQAMRGWYQFARHVRSGDGSLLERALFLRPRMGSSLVAIADGQRHAGGRWVAANNLGDGKSMTVSPEWGPDAAERGMKPSSRT